MVTMQQIAEIAGVSRGTVDRVLNNRGHVNEQTESLILSIAQSMNYVPSKAGRSLAVRKRNIKLACILPSYKGNPFFSQLEVGINKQRGELEDYGVSVDILRFDFSRTDELLSLLNHIPEQEYSGVALCGFHIPQVINAVESLHDRGIPVVTFNTDLPSTSRIAYVGSDYTKSGRIAGQLTQMISPSGANVAVILGSFQIECHSERVSGFQGYLNEVSENIRICCTKENDDDDITSYKIVKDLMGKENPPEVIYMASAGVYGACRAVQEYPKNLRPKIICHDCVPTTEDFIRNGTILAAICQQPEYQGSKPLDILFNAVALGVPPKKEFYYTSNEIILREGLSRSI